ncbi:histidine--tRNA ligase [Candidatus Parcubacteria bacterium]|mgnify:FL=1|nr:MAG: histidine--tRNA ligase [Candidatus Parcubacteria bacterium]
MPRKKANTTKKAATNKPKTSKSVKSKRLHRLRGMKDVLFSESKYWDLVERKAKDLANVYGFQKIATPILEFSDLYVKSTGKETDIVSKEMYAFVDKGGDKVTLRPEATPGAVRAYIEHGMFNLPQPVKMFWMGPLFRHEKPQSGRLRQHTQFDLEIFGEEGPVADTQLILIAYNFFSELQINVQIQINSIGCPECRKDYIEKLSAFYKERGKRSKLCNDCKKRFTKNPLRLLDCKEESCLEVREDAPQIVDFLCDDCREHFIKVLEYLDELEIPYNLNPFLVRGLDYYVKTVFEITPIDEEGLDPSQQKRQISLGGGGRYDGLVELMGGRPTSGCGFGIGLERVIMKIKEKSIPLKEDNENIIFLAQLGEQSKRKMMTLFEELRKAGYNVRQSFTKDSLKNQLEEANRVNAKLVLILGQKELLDGTVMVRDMELGTQEVIDFKKLYPELNKRLEVKEMKLENSATESIAEEK